MLREAVAPLGLGQLGLALATRSDSVPIWRIPLRTNRPLLLAVASSALAVMVAAAEDGLMQAAAGLALLGTLAASLTEALAEPADREAAAATLVVAASGITVLGIGAAFWALVVGLLLRAFLARRPLLG